MKVRFRHFFIKGINLISLHETRIVPLITIKFRRQNVLVNLSIEINAKIVLSLPEAEKRGRRESVVLLCLQCW